LTSLLLGSWRFTADKEVLTNRSGLARSWWGSSCEWVSA